MMISNDDRLCRLLNDAEINMLADLFLSFLDAKTDTVEYRSLRNAVILASYSVKTDDIFRALGCSEQRSSDLVRNDVYALLQNANVSFNKRYNGGKVSLNMPRFKDPTDALLFLGAAFLYIKESEYTVN